MGLEEYGKNRMVMENQSSIDNYYKHNITGIIVGNVVLSEKHSWIKNSKPYSGKVAKGVVLLMAVYNSEQKLPTVFRMIECMDPRPEKVIFCENNSTDRTLEMISKWEYPHELISFYVRKDAVKSGQYDVIALARQFLLKKARKMNAKFAIFLDDDVFPEDRDWLSKLIRWNKPLVGGVYLRQFTEGVFIASKWRVTEPLEIMPQVPNLKEKIEEIKKQGYPNVSFSNCERKLYKVTMTSCGLLAIRNDLLNDTRVNFYPIPEHLSDYSEDFAYCVQAREYGYETYIDGDVRAAHVWATEEKKRPWRVGIEFEYEG